MEGSLSCLNCFARNLSHRSVLSSVNMQWLNSSFCTNMSVQKENPFSLFSARIIGQYCVLVWTQSIRLRSLLVRLIETLTCSFFCIRFCSSLPLISQSALTSASMKVITASTSLRLHTRLLLTDLLDLLRHDRVPRDMQSLSLDLSRLIICAIEL